MRNALDDPPGFMDEISELIDDWTKISDTAFPFSERIRNRKILT
jgi:hypothetical protein